MEYVLSPDRQRWVPVDDSGCVEPIPASVGMPHIDDVRHREYMRRLPVGAKFSHTEIVNAGYDTSCDEHAHVGGLGLCSGTGPQVLYRIKRDGDGWVKVV